MNVSIIRNNGELASLEQEWNQLLGSSAADTIFLTWEWVSSWLEVQPENLELFVIVVRDRKNGLLAVAPFYKTRYRLLECINVSVLRILGDVSSGAEYGNVLIREGHERVAADRIGECLDEARSEWDIVWIPNIAKWRSSYKVLRSVFENRQLSNRERTRQFSSAALPPRSEDFFSAMSANRRQQLRRTCRKVSRNPNIKVVQVSDPDRLQHYLDVLFELHARRWGTRGDAGSFARDARLKAFYYSFAPKALLRGWLRMIALTDGDRVIAIQYGFRYGDTYMQLQEGFDPNGINGSGTALRKAGIDIFIDESITEYDFLGGFTEHKRRWLALERQGCDTLAANHRLLSRLIFSSGIWPTGRFLKPV